jgi:hypothetical protein
VPRIKSKNLYDLIKSLNKNEKRYFTLVASASGSSEDKKMLLLFNHINKQSEFDENIILKKSPTLKPTQLSNLKAYLFEKILQCIRQYNAEKIPDIKIREQIDFAQLLFERRLYALGKNSLRKAKKMAAAYNNLELQLEIIKLEKSVLMHILDDAPIEADKIIQEVQHINKQINNINIYSNLSVKLNSYYTKIGYIRNESEYLKVKEFYFSTLPSINQSELSSIEKTYLYRLFVGYYFFIQDFDNGYLYSQKLVDLFESEKNLMLSGTEAYISSLNNLLIAQYRLFKFEDFIKTNTKLQSVKDIGTLNINENIRIRLLKYFYMHEINRYFMTGEFNLGVEKIMKEQFEQIQTLTNMLDAHSELVMNYKIACLYFGAASFNNSLKWLNKIINTTNVDIREDLHCFARIINLICHYELGNFDVIKYYIISTYRFLLKKEDLHSFQKYILSFIKNLRTEMNESELVERFKKLKMELVPLIDSPYEKRAFIYFDIISWLESKIESKPVEEIIKDKFKQRMGPAVSSQN